MPANTKNASKPSRATTGQTASTIASHLNAHTDLGHATAFLRYCGDEVRWCQPAKKWLIWDSKAGRWQWDDTLEIIDLAKKTIGHNFLQALHQNKTDEQLAWTKAGDKRKIEAMLELAKSDVAVLPNDLDADPYLFCVRNGTIDLRSGQVRTSVPEDLITKQAGVSYDPNAKAPRWEQFLEDVFAGDQDLIAYLQRAVGYTLTGATDQQCFFILEGPGGNGKTTFIETLKAMCGDYAVRTEFDTFVHKDSKSSSNDVARLAGARLIAASEGEEGQRLAEARIKEFTGGDSVTARFLYREFFTFKPVGKIWLDTNHLPVVVGTNEGIWRRIRRIPFTVRMTPDKRDEQLLAKLIGTGGHPGELSGILNWALEGLAQYRQIGLAEPASITAAGDDYREEMDEVSRFLDECCRGWRPGEQNTELSISQAAFYAGFRAWCEQVGRHPWKEATFSLRLKTRAQTLGTFTQRKTSRGRVWDGIDLKPEAIPTPF